MGRMDKYDEQAREMFAAWEQRAAERVGEPIQGACVCSRGGLMQNKLAGKFGALPYALSRKHNEVKAGGLPDTFMLVITAARLHAFACKTKAGGELKDIGDEVAVWDLAGLRVSSGSGGPYQLSITIESPAEGEKVQCAVGATASGREFAERLQAAATAATA